MPEVMQAQGNPSKLRITMECRPWPPPGLPCTHQAASASTALWLGQRSGPWQHEELRARAAVTGSVVSAAPCTRLPVPLSTLSSRWTAHRATGWQLVLCFSRAAPAQGGCGQLLFCSTGPPDGVLLGAVMSTGSAFSTDLRQPLLSLSSQMVAISSCWEA